MAKLPPLYHRVLRRSFDELPREIRDMHEVHGILRSEGRCSIVRGSGLVPRAVAMLSGIPRAGHDIPLTVEMRKKGLYEVWRRNFGGSKLKTRLRRDPHNGLIRERHGPVTMIMRLIPEPDGLTMHGEGMEIFGIPMPRFLWLKMQARETVEDGKFTFEVSVALPLAGRLVRYRGWLVPVESIELKERAPVVKPAKRAPKRRPKSEAKPAKPAAPATAETSRPPHEPTFVDPAPEPEARARIKSREEPTRPGPFGRDATRPASQEPAQRRAVLVRKQRDDEDRTTEVSRG